MAELELFYFPGSFFSQKAVIALEEKRVPFRRRFVLLPYGEVHEPWYVRLNPNGTVPTLTHGHVVITDSQDIIHYMDDNFPEFPLIPSEPSKRAEVQECLAKLATIEVETLTYGGLANRQLTRNATIPNFLADRAQGTMKVKVSEAYVNKLQRYADENPDLKGAYEQKLRVTQERAAQGYGDKSFPEGDVIQARDHAAEVLRQMDAILERHKLAGKSDNWLCGPDFTAADILLGLTLERMTMVGFSYVWLDGEMTNLQKYYLRISSRTSFRNQFKKAALIRMLLLFVFRHKAPYVEAGMKVLGVGLVALGVFGVYKALTG